MPPAEEDESESSGGVEEHRRTGHDVIHHCPAGTLSPHFVEDGCSTWSGFGERVVVVVGGMRVVEEVEKAGAAGAALAPFFSLSSKREMPRPLLFLLLMMMIVSPCDRRDGALWEAAGRRGHVAGEKRATKREGERKIPTTFLVVRFFLLLNKKKKKKMKRQDVWCFYPCVDPKGEDWRGVLLQWWFPASVTRHFHVLHGPLFFLVFGPAMKGYARIFGSASEKRKDTKPDREESRNVSSCAENEHSMNGQPTKSTTTI